MFGIAEVYEELLSMQSFADIEKPGPSYSYASAGGVRMNIAHSGDHHWAC